MTEAELRELLAPIEARWPGSADFLVVKAFNESGDRRRPEKGVNPKAGSDTGNDARGLFGLKPDSAKVPRAEGWRLKDPVRAIAYALDYARRLMPFRRSGQKVDWYAMARGWRYPRLVKDVEWAAAESAVVRDRLEIGMPPLNVSDADFRRLVPDDLPTVRGALEVLAEAGVEPGEPAEGEGGGAGILAAVGIFTVAAFAWLRRKKR